MTPTRSEKENTAPFKSKAKFTFTAHATELLIEESYNSYHSREIMLSGSTIDTFEARAERVTFNHAISVVFNQQQQQHLFIPKEK